MLTKEDMNISSISKIPNVMHLVGWKSQELREIFFFFQLVISSASVNLLGKYSVYLIDFHIVLAVQMALAVKTQPAKAGD